MTYLSKSDFKTKYLDYTVAAKGAQGGYGTNFLTEKYIVKTQAHLKNFIQELNICSSFDCPYVMKVLDWTYDEIFSNHYIFAQPRGVLLKEAIVKKYITLEQAAKDIYLGMRFLHDNDLIHLDIKPDNVVCLQENGQWRAVLIDFGISMYGYRYRNGLFTYKMEYAYTPEYRDPEYDYYTYNSYDSDYYAYAISMIQLYKETVQGNRTYNLIFSTEIMKDDDNYKNLKEVCDFCLNPKRNKYTIREDVEKLPFFDFLKTLDFSELKSKPDPQITNLNLNKQIFQEKKTILSEFQKLFASLIGSLEIRIRTGFLALHLFQLFLSKTPSFLTVEEIKTNYKIYMIGCYILAYYIYSEKNELPEQNLNKILMDNDKHTDKDKTLNLNLRGLGLNSYYNTRRYILVILNILKYFDGRVRYLTLYDYARCGTELYIHFYSTLKPDYLDFFYNRKNIYQIDSCKIDGDDKNILFTDVLEKMNTRIVSKDSSEKSNKRLSNNSPVDLPKFPLASPVDLNTSYEVTSKLIDEFNNKLKNIIFRYNYDPYNGIYFALEFLYEVISKKRIYQNLSTQDKDDVLQSLKTFYKNYLQFEPYKIYFPEIYPSKP